MRFLKDTLLGLNPHLVALDSHPGRRFTGSSVDWLNKGRWVWKWTVNAAAMGESQARERNVLVSTRLDDTTADHTAPLFISDVLLPSGISEFLTPSARQREIKGKFKISANSDSDVTLPVPWGG